MRNILVFSVAITCYLLSVPLLLAEGSVESAAPPTANVVETSRPVFDPELFKVKKSAKALFFEEIRQERVRFHQKQLQKKRDFLEKIRNKGRDPGALQKEILKFHGKQNKKLEKFINKEQKKIQKHSEKNL